MPRHPASSIQRTSSSRDHTFQVSRADVSEMLPWYELWLARYCWALARDSPGASVACARASPARRARATNKRIADRFTV